MAVNAGEVSVALALEDGEFLAGLAAAKASLAGLADELAQLAAPAVDFDWNILPPDLAAQFAAVGAQGMAGFAAGIASGAGAASASATNVASAAVSAAGSGMSGASSIGSSFAAGLAAGISAGRSGVVAAAASVARAAAAAARSALAIHSPSKVTEEFGEYFDLGFIRGVERLTPDIERSVRAAVRTEPPAGAAWSAGREAVPTVTVKGQAIDYRALASAMREMQLVLTMDNRRLAEVQQRQTARVQSERSRRIALGYGK